MFSRTRAAFASTHPNRVINELDFHLSRAGHLNKRHLYAIMPSADPLPPSLGPSKPFSISLGSKAKPKSTPASKPSPLNAAKKRPHSALADPDSDNEETSAGPETVTGFDSGKAISISNGAQTKAPLVIKSEKNRDWKEESRKKKGKNLLPAEAQAAQNGSQNGQAQPGSNVERSEVSTEAGLRFVPKKEDADGDTPMTNNDQPEAKPHSADDEAIAALLGAQKQSTLTIPSQDGAHSTTNGHNDPEDEYTNESDRFRADVESRPPPASLSDYAAVPVEEFGAAILRGLGWKEGMAVGKRNGQVAKPPREVQRRPALLGIGAKETPGGVPREELGAWGGGKKGRGKEKVAYNPVMLRDTVTGEMVTEEEVELRKLEAKQKAAKGDGGGRKEDDWRERRDRNLKIDERNKSERRDKEKGRLVIEDVEERRSGSSSSRRERSRERDRDRENYRKRDYKRERSRSDERSRHGGSSRRERSRSRERSKYGSSKRERSRSMERKHRRRDDDDHERRDRDKDRKRRDDDDNDRRGRDSKRH